MNSIEFLSSFFDLMSDLKHAQIAKPDPDKEFYVVTMFLDLEGDEEDE